MHIIIHVCWQRKLFSDSKDSFKPWYNLGTSWFKQDFICRRLQGWVASAQYRNQNIHDQHREHNATKHDEDTTNLDSLRNVTRKSQQRHRICEAREAMRWAWRYRCVLCEFWVLATCELETDRPRLRRLICQASYVSMMPPWPSDPWGERCRKDAKGDVLRLRSMLHSALPALPLGLEVPCLVPGAFRGWKIAQQTK